MPDTTPAITVTEPTAGPHYPQADTHTWGAFATLAIECGGYGDLEAVDPYTGRRCHTYAWCKDSRLDLNAYDDNVYTALRRLIDAMEREQFLG